MRGGWALAHILFERDKKCFARFDFNIISNLHGSIVSFLTKTGSVTYNSNSLENLIHLYSIVWGNSQGTEGQFSENICSEGDLRSRIFGAFVVKFLACLPLLGFSNI